MYMRCAAALVTASLISGCAIHPVPEDVTGLDTADIVKQIRCETRDAARRVIRERLERLAGPGRNSTAQSLLAQFEENPEAMDGFDPNSAFPGLENKQIRNLFTVIYSTAIAYSFDLTMYEANKLSAGASFLGPWADPFTLGLGGTADRSRQNQRAFTITDEFSFLLTRLNTDKFGRRYCDGRITGPNYVYPVAGQIGIYNTVYTFFQLSIFENLSPGKNAAEASAKSPPLADKLTFITDVGISATPSVTFAPFKSGFRPTGATGTGSLGRKDTHDVTIGLAMEPAGGAAVASLSGFVFSGAGLPGPRVTFGKAGAGQTLVLNRITATATSRAAQLALFAIDQLKTREIQLIPPPQ